MEILPAAQTPPRGDAVAAAQSRPDRDRRGPGRSLDLVWSARMTLDGATSACIVIQISEQGLRVRSPLQPRAGAAIIIDLPGVPLLSGEVRWSDSVRFGVLLDQPINVVDVMRAHRRATGSHLGLDRRV